MVSVMHLAEEVCAGAEIYYTGKTGGQYFKTAFILCDDYTELSSKLFLIQSDSNWSDKKNNGQWKSYHQVLRDAYKECEENRAEVADRIVELQIEMRARRERRNEFFHSANLLDLSITFRTCVEAFCHLFEYCDLLFDEWERAVASVRNLETLMLLFELDRCALSNPAISSRVNDVVGDWARNKSSKRTVGVQEAQFPEDLHLRMCVINGSIELRDRLRVILDGVRA